MSFKRIRNKMRKQKEIAIRYVNKKDAMIHTDGSIPTDEVCDMLLSALCVSLQVAATQAGSDLEILKEVVINEIKKIK